MELRDEIAIAVLPAVYAGYFRENNTCIDENWREGLAADAYALADSMLTIRSTRMNEHLEAAPKGATHCDHCGCTWLDDGLNPIGCPYCKTTGEALSAPDGIMECLNELLDNAYSDGTEGRGCPSDRTEEVKAKLLSMLASAPTAPAGNRSTDHG